jgi:hypothetical protein
MILFGEPAYPPWDTFTDAIYDEYDFILLTCFFTFSMNRSLGRICQQLENFPRDAIAVKKANGGTYLESAILAARHKHSG